MGSPINNQSQLYTAPLNPAPKLAETTRQNPYLTSSPYENMQLHTPSGLYYNNGKVYEAYTPSPLQKVLQGFNMFGGAPRQSSTTGGPVAGSISSGDQWFRPYTGNAAGIINGDISMVYGLGKNNVAYQPQPMADLFPSLNTNLLSSSDIENMQGAGKFLGNNLLGSPIVTSNTSKGQ